MASDEQEPGDAQAADPTTYQDYIAARTEAYRSLLETVNTLGEEDLQKEGLAMLKAVRRSFKTMPEGELVALPGGKG